jgi:hypothetical protein
VGFSANNKNKQPRIPLMMHMKKGILFAMLMICALTSAAIYGTWAQTESLLGIKAGDNFTYYFEVLWSSTDPSLTVPQALVDMNDTFSVHFNVTEVSTTTAFVNITNSMRDGTQTSTPGFINVVDGRGSNALLFIIQANLTAGDQAYSMADSAAVTAGAAAEPFTITETVTKTYLGTIKTTNHYTERINNATTGDYTDRNAYYDKETGVLLELTLTYYDATYQEMDSEHWRINQFNSESSSPSDGTTDGTNGTNTGALPEWLLPVVFVVLVVIIAMLIVAIVLNRRKKPQTEPPTSPSTPPQELV